MHTKAVTYMYYQKLLSELPKNDKESEVISGQRMENAANGFVSISMPQTPKTPKKVLFSENPKEVSARVAPYDFPSETKSENKKVITIFGTMAMETLMSTILHPTASKTKHYTLPAALQSSLESLTKFINLALAQ
ncbi:unnamed protein product [Amaranthus hypochondriacus]